MNLGAVLGRGRQHVQAEPRTQTGPIKFSLHGEGRAQKPHPFKPLAPDQLARGISDMNERNGDRRRHLVGNHMHGVGADQTDLRATPLQSPRRIGDEAPRLLPTLVNL